MTRVLWMPARLGLTAALLGAAACGDEGVTHVDGPFPIIPLDSGMSEMDEDAGDAGGEPLPPCPTGYMCTDLPGQLSSMGLQGTVTDPDGKPLRYACAKGQEPCSDPMNPSASCPNFPQAVCAHVKLSIGVEIDNCVQRCSP
jgi:hypothetical protein